jgi:hypothetical protein
VEQPLHPLPFDWHVAEQVSVGTVVHAPDPLQTLRPVRVLLPPPEEEVLVLVLLLLLLLLPDPHVPLVQTVVPVGPSHTPVPATQAVMAQLPEAVQPLTQQMPPAQRLLAH